MLLIGREMVLQFFASHHRQFVKGGGDTLDIIGVGKSHITCLNSKDMANIFVEQFHLRLIGFKIKSDIVSEPIIHLVNNLF